MAGFLIVGAFTANLSSVKRVSLIESYNEKTPPAMAGFQQASSRHGE
jgi:hypothetical protein